MGIAMQPRQSIAFPAAPVRTKEGGAVFKESLNKPKVCRESGPITVSSAPLSGVHGKGIGDEE